MMTLKKPTRPGITWRPCVRESGPWILGVNPWVYDFAAYNLWSRPAGLLVCLDMLAKTGARTALMDCMDRTWQDQTWPAAGTTGTGRYPRTVLPRPGVLAVVPRRYSRYGLPGDRVEQALARLDPPPDLILITSIMTYWYPGIFAAVRMLRRLWPGVPVCLGGVYATLCREHARSLDVDLVVSGPLEEENNWAKVWSLLGSSPPKLPRDAGMSLDTSFYAQSGYSVIMGSRGCPFRCSYCSGYKLYPGFRQADAGFVFEHVRGEYMRGIRDFAFYDDALLVNARNLLIPLLEKIISSGLEIRLHTPNALHVRYLDLEVCRLLYRAGLHTIRLGFETGDFGSRPDKKLGEDEWCQGMHNLLQAGFTREQMAAYVLFGLPGQGDEEVLQSIREVRRWGIRPELTQYSPIPGSMMFEEAVKHAWLGLDDPLAHNNSIWPCVPGGFTWEKRGYWNQMAAGA
ncbi:radical SAM protein [Desulfonatronospira sp.]|uniref:B12-binding domain-containing radical SAM protein n=1 Tax=Desulfonatronospira sp. TaxID=1962951 RepID=UPI0025BE8CBF|nr:radical SAM protein [Desulfonatronospira sp.]